MSTLMQENNPVGAIGTDIATVLSTVYPIGSIYMSVNNVNPSTLFGGTWVEWGSGKVPVGVDTNDTDFDTVEETGGVKDVTLTSAQSGIPAHAHGLNSHTHSIPALSGTASSTNSNHTHSTSTNMQLISITGSNPDSYTGSGNNGIKWCTISSSGAHSHSVTTNASTTGQATGSTANNTAANATEAHTNLQPYITCYMWKRTA